MISAERRAEKVNGQAEGGGGEDQMAVTACHAVGGVLVKQRRLNTVEAGGEDITAGDAAGGEGVGIATASGGAVGEVGVDNIVGNTAGGAGVGVDFATVFDAVGGGGEQISLTSLL